MPSPLTPEQRVVALRKLSALKPFQWNCGIAGCDGQPHRSTNPLQAMPHRHARAKQLPPPGDWWAWFLMSGRGFGKTRTGAEYVKQRATAEKGHRVAIIVPDFAVGRDVCIEGESGLIGGPGQPGLFPPGVVKLWNRSIGELHLHNGAMFKIFGTDKRKDAEALRGYQCHTAWFEELGTQAYGEVAWDMLTFALRLGSDPRVVITGTPRPTKLIRKLVKDDGVIVTGGTTYENAANLAPKMLERIKLKYEHTTLGLQELHGELLDGAKGALWTYDLIKHHTGEIPDLVRVVVGVDPAGSAHKTSDLTGIVVVGIDAAGVLWVLADKSGRYSPEQWARVAAEAYAEFEADAVVGEKNYGGDMVRSTLRAADYSMPIKLVTASRGKAVRAGPVVTLYERKRVIHAGVHADLEQELTTWVPPGQYDEEGNAIEPSDWSPDHMDAEVWAVYELAVRPMRRRATSHFEAD